MKQEHLLGGIDKVSPMQTAEEEEVPAFGDDDHELQKSLLEWVRKIALKKQEEKSGSFMMNLLLASSNVNEPAYENPNTSSGDQSENKVVFVEMEEFVWGLHLDEEEKKPGSENVAPNTSDQDEDGGRTEVLETMTDVQDKKEDHETTLIIHEAPIGKGLAGTLRRLEETNELGGQNMDKKRSKRVGEGEGGTKEIHIERRDEYGRMLTPKEAFRQISRKFHGIHPGKMKQEKRMRQYHKELKIKQMQNADTPSLSASRMREAQAKLKTPYLVLS